MAARVAGEAEVAAVVTTVVAAMLVASVAASKDSVAQGHSLSAAG